MQSYSMSLSQEFQIRQVATLQKFAKIKFLHIFLYSIYSKLFGALSNNSSECHI